MWNKQRNYKNEREGKVIEVRRSDASRGVGGRGIFALRSQPGPDGGIDLPGAGPGQTILFHHGITPRAPGKLLMFYPTYAKLTATRWPSPVVVARGNHKCWVFFFLLKVRAPFVPHLCSNPGGSEPKLRIDPEGRTAGIFASTLMQTWD